MVEKWRKIKLFLFFLMRVINRLVLKCGKFPGSEYRTHHPFKVFCIETQYVLTWSDTVVTHRLSRPVFQPLQVKYIEKWGGNWAWKKQWELCLKEAVPLEESAFCVFQRSQQPSQTVQRKDFQQLKEKNAKRKKIKEKAQISVIGHSFSCNWL